MNLSLSTFPTSKHPFPHVLLLMIPRNKIASPSLQMEKRGWVTSTSVEFSDVTCLKGLRWMMGFSLAQDYFSVWAGSGMAKGERGNEASVLGQRVG